MKPNRISKRLHAAVIWLRQEGHTVCPLKPCWSLLDGKPLPNRRLKKLAYPMTALTALALFVLAACSPAQQGQFATVVSDVQQACVSVSPALAAGAASTNAAAKSIAGFGNAVCGPVMGGSLPATVNASTPTWLGSLAGMIQTLLPLAVGLL